MTENNVSLSTRHDVVTCPPVVISFDISRVSVLNVILFCDVSKNKKIKNVRRRVSHGWRVKVCVGAQWHYCFKKKNVAYGRVHLMKSADRPIKSHTARDRFSGMPTYLTIFFTIIWDGEIILFYRNREYLNSLPGLQVVGLWYRRFAHRPFRRAPWNRKRL